MRQWVKIETAVSRGVKMKRKSFNTEFKAKVAIEAIKGHKTVNELASEFEIYPARLTIGRNSCWMAPAILSAVASRSVKPSMRLKRIACISRLASSRLSWIGLKKRLGISLEP